MSVRLVRVFSAMMGILLIGGMGVGGASAASALAPSRAGAVTAVVISPPAAPVMAGVESFVDGVRVGWYRGTVSSTAPAPTSYLVTRSGVDGDVTITVPSSPYNTLGSYDDRATAVGEEVTYTVTAVNSAGPSAPSGESDPVAKAAWDGPYDGAKSALVAVWDEGSAGPGDLDSILADTTLRYGIAGSFVFGYDWRHSMDPVTVPDGTYEVGAGDGQLPLVVRAGAPCVNPAGSATVSRTAYALAGLASQSVDAELECGNGHHLSVRFRWRTPDAYPLLRMEGIAVTTTPPGGNSTATATVRNDGNAPLSVSSVRLLALPDGAAAGLTVLGTSCTGGSLLPGGTCTVNVAFSPASGAVAESRALLLLDTPLGVHESGIVVGQLEGRGQKAPSGVSAPRGLTLTWTAPTSVAKELIGSYRIERQDAAGPTVVATATPVHVSGNAWQRALGVVATGAHVYRVVLVTTDDRELASPWATVRVPESWLVLATAKGALPVNPDDGWTTGGTFGYIGTSTNVPMTMAADPRRTSFLTTMGNGYSGHVTRLTPTDSSGYIAPSSYAPAVADVSPNGSRGLIVRPRVTAGDDIIDPGAVLLLDAATSALAEVPNSALLTSPQWLPDGSAFLAVADEARIVRVDATTGARTTVLTEPNLSGLALSRQGRMAFVRADGWYNQTIVETTLAGSGRRTVASYSLPGTLRYDPTGRYLFIGAHAWTEGEASRVYDLLSTPAKLTATLPISSDAAWWDPVSSTPTVTVSLPPWTTRTPTITISHTDPDDAVGGLSRRCRLDNGAWSACTTTWRPAALAPGTHTVTAEVKDPAGTVGTRSVTWQVDGTAPTASLPALPTATLGTTLNLAWSAADVGSGLKSYDVRYRRASTGSGFGAWTTARTALTTKSTTLSVTQGYQYCLSVRAHDVAGNMGAWSPERCTSVAQDDRSLTASKGWTRTTSSAALFGTVTRGTSSAISLTRSGVSGRQIGLVATTCSTCGSVDVYLGGTKLGRIYLSSTTTRYRQVKWLPLLTSTRTGTLTLRTTSSRATLIDGFLVAH